MRPRVAVQQEVRRVALRVTGVTVAIVPNYPGSTNVPAGTWQSAITHLGDTKANVSTTATVEQLAAVQQIAEEATNTVAGFEGQLGGLQQAQTDLQAEVTILSGTLANFNIAGLDTFTLDASENPVFTYTDGATKTFTGVRIPKGYRGTATLAPTVAGAVGDFFLNVGSLDVVGWCCTTAGNAAG